MEHEPMGSGTGAIVRITVPPHGAEETRTDRAGIQDRERDKYSGESDFKKKCVTNRARLLQRPEDRPAAHQCFMDFD